MKNLSTLKVSMAVAIASFSFMGAAYADNNGGLMKEMMNPAYQPQQITNPAAQAQLHAVQVRGDLDGGLMEQLSTVKSEEIHFSAADQQYLNSVVLRDAS